jgi:hypothetical protein
MAPIAALWLPIVLSAVIVFVASSVMHVLLKYHESDCHRLPDEDKLLAELRSAGLSRGLYMFPYGGHKEMKSPAMQEKYKQGPVGMMTVFPSGLPAMPKFMGMWFVYCLVISFFTADLTGHTVAPGANYRSIHGLRAGTAQQWHLEGPAVGHDHQGSRGRIDLWFADRRHVWVAVATVV